MQVWPFQCCKQQDIQVWFAFLHNTWILHYVTWLYQAPTLILTEAALAKGVTSVTSVKFSDFQRLYFRKKKYSLFKCVVCHRVSMCSLAIILLLRKFRHLGSYLSSVYRSCKNAIYASRSGWWLLGSPTIQQWIELPDILRSPCVFVNPKWRR